VSELYSYCTKFHWNLCRDIEVTHGEENHIGEGLQSSKSTCTILNDPDDPVQPFCYGVGQSTSNKGKYSVTMFFNGFGEFPDGLQATSKGSGDPTLDKPLCSPGCLVVPKLLKLIL